MVILALGFCLSYLIGSLPTAYLFGRISKGIDIRQHGSGNVGATNAFRVLGKKIGIIVLIIDIVKGILAIVLVANLFHIESVLGLALLGIAVVVGHNWTVFLNFKGGKGIATSLGVLIGLTVEIPPLRSVVFLCLGVWLVIFLFSGYVSLASVLAGCSLPVVMIFSGQSKEMIVLGIIFCLFVVLRHRPNIKRLLTGQEAKISFWIHKKS
jgi:acyl phosphate:glycerol-3-phosphate acyltransferase